MMRFFQGLLSTLIMGGVIAAVFFYAPFWWENSKGQVADLLKGAMEEAARVEKKTKEELRKDALERSSDIRGLYMTADVAGDTGTAGTHLRNNIIKLAETSEINGIVIDVKEVCGPDYNEENLRKFLSELRQKKIWTIGRIVAFKDGSQIYAHPEWYLKRKTAVKAGDECYNRKHLRTPASDSQKSSAPLWQDKRGGYWLDPASAGAREYILSLSKKMIDFGFDELQFDYVRFPSDGDVQNAIYPSWDWKTPRYVVMKGFFEFLNKGLRDYKPDIILSADLFGYVAAQHEELSIGQRLEDIGENFDYISFMVYPSHYYNGLVLPPDPGRKLGAVNFSLSDARRNPGTVVERSLLIARDFLDLKFASSTVATATPVEVSALPRYNVRFRPWLEDFYHEEDKAAGRPYGAEKVRQQIDAAESVEPHGWLLWNAANIYTENALNKE